MLLKEKRDKNAKGQACADGRKQRKWSEKKDDQSPLVALELVLIISEIGTHKSRGVSMLDIHREFLTTYMDEDVIIVL